MEIIGTVLESNCIKCCWLKAETGKKKCGKVNNMCRAGADG
jgi:hypothetical protein